VEPNAVLLSQSSYCKAEQAVSNLLRSRAFGGGRFGSQKKTPNSE